MSSIPILLAVEDELSESVARTILKQIDRGYAVGTVFRRGGFGQLRKNAKEFNRAARGIPYLMLTDLDDSPCPSSLIADWLGTIEAAHPNFIFRIAIREVEAWLLADRTNLAEFLRVPDKLFPKEDVELLEDPKKTLVEIAARSRSREIKERIAPKRGSTAKQGPEYNACLDEFVRQGWNFRAAAREAPSLDRAVRCLAAFEPTWK